MIRHMLETDQFKKKLCDSLMKEMSTYQTINIVKHNDVYIGRDKEDLVYFIEVGQVKVLMRSLEGKECIVAIHSLGDVFGKFCIGRLDELAEKVIAMSNTQLKTISYTKFLAHLTKESLLEGFVKYLGVRLAEKKQVIANLLLVNSEQRLGKTLLQLAKCIGKKSSDGTIIELYISHSDLSEMVGTTRPRVSFFMRRFCNLGLVTMIKGRYMMIEEQKLSQHLAKLAKNCLTN